MLFLLLIFHLLFLFSFTLSFPVALWSFSLQAVRTANFSTASHPHRRVRAASSLLLPLSPSPSRHLPTAVANFRSTSPSSQGAKPWTWLHSAVLPTAMQACTPPCHPSVRPPLTSTSSTCPAPWPAKSLTRESPKPKAKPKSQSSASKVRAAVQGIFFSFSQADVYCGNSLQVLHCAVKIATHVLSFN